MEVTENTNAGIINDTRTFALRAFGLIKMLVKFVRVLEQLLWPIREKVKPALTALLLNKR